MSNLFNNRNGNNSLNSRYPTKSTTRTPRNLNGTYSSIGSNSLYTTSRNNGYGMNTNTYNLNGGNKTTDTEDYSENDTPRKFELIDQQGQTIGTFKGRHPNQAADKAAVRGNQNINLYDKKYGVVRHYLGTVERIANPNEFQRAHGMQYKGKATYQGLTRVHESEREQQVRLQKEQERERKLQQKQYSRTHAQQQQGYSQYY